jgi:hypothetical protein
MLLAHLGDGCRPSWPRVVGVVLPPVWPQGQPVPMTAAGATVAALTGSTQGPSSGPDGRCQRYVDGRRGGVGRDPGARSSPPLGPKAEPALGIAFDDIGTP